MPEDEIFHMIFRGWGGEGFWFVNSLLAILITGIIMGTLYAIAYAFNLMGLKRYAASEFMQLAATAVMVVFLVQLIILGQGFFASTVGERFVVCKGEHLNDTIDAAKCRTEERLEYFNNMFWEVKNGLNALPESMESRYYFSMSVFGVTIYQGSWDPDVHRFVETGHSIAYKLVSLMVSLNSQLFVLKYIQETMLSVFLPLGIVLRTFHFTRGMGGFFIALAISLYFIYPNVLFMMESAYGPSPPAPPPPVMNREQLCNIPVFSGFSLGSVAMEEGGVRSAAALSVSSSDLAAFVSEAFVRLFYNNMVAFAIAVTAMRYGTMLLGGESGVFLQMMARWV